MPVLDLSADLPAEVVEALGPDPKREVLATILLFLVNADRMSVARPGEILGLDRLSSIRWYTSHGFYYLDLSEEDLAEGLRERIAPEVCSEVYEITQTFIETHPEGKTSDSEHTDLECVVLGRV